MKMKRTTVSAQTAFFLAIVLGLATFGCLRDEASDPSPTIPKPPPTLQDDHPQEPSIERGGIEVLKDMEYTRYQVGGEERKLLLDLYLPTNQGSQPFPLLIFIHGGGWMFGDKSTCPGDIVASRGYAMASINYRLSGEAIFPAQIHDVKAAVRWLRANAGRYNIDPDHFGAWGDSAGGHLSALLGTSAEVSELEGGLENREVSSEIQAVCDWYGPTDFAQVPPASSGDPWLEYTLVTTQLLGGPVSERPELAELANPITHVDPSDPPFLIVHGEMDDSVPIEQSQLLADALHENGVDVTLVRDPNLGHSYAGPEGEEFSPKLISMAIDFFDAYLRPRR